MHEGCNTYEQVAEDLLALLEHTGLPLNLRTMADIRRLHSLIYMYVKAAEQSDYVPESRYGRAVKNAIVHQGEGARATVSTCPDTEVRMVRAVRGEVKRPIGKAAAVYAADGKPVLFEKRVGMQIAIGLTDTTLQLPGGDYDVAMGSLYQVRCRLPKADPDRTPLRHVEQFKKLELLSLRPSDFALPQTESIPRTSYMHEKAGDGSCCGWFWPDERSLADIIERAKAVATN